MKAWLIEKFGGADVMQIAEIAKPVPTANEVLVKIAYTSANPVDWKIREGKVKEAIPHHFPIILGWDVAGVVQEVGAAVTDFKSGDRVFAYARKPTVQWGTYAEYITLDSSSVAKIPQSLNLREAAAVPLTSLIAHQALIDFAALKPGDTVFINGGAGGVGSFAIQLAKLAGATVITTADKKNEDYVRRLGADIAIDYKKEDSVRIILSHFPKGVDVALDCVGGTALNLSWEVIKSGGRLVCIVEEPDQQKARSKDVKAAFLFVEARGDQLAHIAQLFDEGHLKSPSIEETTILAAPKVLEANRLGRTRGKVVMKIDFNQLNEIEEADLK